jgi:flagellar protein FlbD
VRAFVVQPPGALADYRDVIRLHRLGHPGEDYHLNPDLIVSIEATPDTVVTLTNHTKLIVLERPEQVVEAILAWRASVLETGLPRIRRRSDVPLSIVRGEHAPPEERER